MSTTETAGPRFPWPAKGLGAILDFATASKRRAVAALVGVCLLAFVPGFFHIPPVDRDEARFAQATKQMVQSGDYVDIHFQDEVRYKKPVGIYWLQAAVVKTATALGVREAFTTIWLYRIPSLLGAIGAVLLTFWAALAFVPRRAAVLAALMLAASFLLGVEARLAKTDAMLLASVVAAMGAMARVYLGEIRHPGIKTKGLITPAIFWTALAGGILLKGPVILMVAGLTVAALVVLDRSARWLLALRPVIGIAWLILLVLPWFLLIVSRAGGVFFAQSFGHDMFEKVVSAQESHGAPPGYYLLLFFVTFWPGSMLAGLATPHVIAARREAPARFLLAWLVPSWLVFELVLTKLPHYVLPLYPAIAILIAGCLDFHRLSRAVWLVRGTLWWFLVPAIISAGAIYGLVVIGGDLGLFAWPFAAVAVILGYLAWWLYEVDGAERALLRAAASSVFVAIAIYGVVLPSLTALFPSVELAAVVREADCPEPVAAAAGYQEPSLVFLAGTQTVLTDAAGAADFLRRGGCRYAFVETHLERSFAQRAEAIGLRYRGGPRIDAFNMSTGRQIVIAVFRAADQP
jgi:4-amino-4-deoxy-L-arabinose transferase-like glycosyltransferase